MSNRKQKESFPAKLLQAGKHIVFHNWGFKVLALLISIVLWAGLISQDVSLTRDKVFNDVSVNVTGTDTMKRNGYIITSDLSEALTGVTAVAAVPQQQYERAEISSYNVRLDLSRITGTGEQELRLASSNSTTYGRITSLNPASVKVEVEDYVVRYRIPVSVSVVGESPEGWYMSTPSVDPPLVAVSGPKSLVSSISRARVFLNPEEVDWAEGTTIFTSGLTLYSRSGEEITNPLLEVSYDNVMLDSVVLEATILPTRSFQVASQIGMVNEPAEGYEVKAVHVSPEKVTVAARSEVLSEVGELALSERLIDLAGLDETTSFQIKVSKPSDDAVLSNDTITVTVEVGPVEAEESDPEGA
ncbi:MAG: hypothetical protein IJ188_08150 [Clostridia bacterium]|nr:hypothetical protein [Clostridia bacterium]